MCVDLHAYLSGVTHMRQELTVWQIKSHFSIVCRFYLFSHISMIRKKCEIRFFQQELVYTLKDLKAVVVVVVGVGVYHK